MNNNNLSYTISISNSSIATTIYCIKEEIKTIYGDMYQDYGKTLFYVDQKQFCIYWKNAFFIEETMFGTERVFDSINEIVNFINLITGIKEIENNGE